MRLVEIIESMKASGALDDFTLSQNKKIHQLLDVLSDANDIANSTISIEDLRQLRLELISNLNSIEETENLLVGFDELFEKIISMHMTNVHKGAIEQLMITNRGLQDERDMYTNIFEAFVHPVLYLDEHLQIKLANVAGITLLEKLSVYYLGETRFNVDFSNVYQAELDAFLNDTLSDYVNFYDENLDAIFYFLRAEKLIGQNSGYMVYIIENLISVINATK